MTDKKLTDNEIKKALECCMNGYCDDCPFRETREHCHNLDSLILDLINRLQAENEELKSAINGFRDYDDKIKAEAYKECIEKVKEKSKKTEVVCSGALVTMSYAISNKNLDNLLKELVGDNNGT